jgi:hypothetical protein
VRVWGNEPVSPTFSSPSAAAAARGALSVPISKTLSPGAVGLELDADRWVARHGAHQQQQHGAALAAAPRARPTYAPLAAIPSRSHPNSPLHFFGFAVPVNSPSPLRCRPANLLVVGVSFFENCRMEKMLRFAICVLCNGISHHLKKTVFSLVLCSRTWISLRIPHELHVFSLQHTVYNASWKIFHLFLLLSTWSCLPYCLTSSCDSA